MNGLGDLLFVAMIAWFLLRAVSRGRRQLPPDAEGLPDREGLLDAEGEPPQRLPQPPVRTPMRPPAPRRLSPIEEMRRRLLAEAQRWEEERKRLEAGQGPERPGTPPELGRPGVPVPTPPGAPPSEVRELPSLAPSARRPQPVAPPEARPSQAGETERPRGRSAPAKSRRRHKTVAPLAEIEKRVRGMKFPEFKNRSPQQRAILYSVILGLPKGAESSIQDGLPPFSRGP